MESTVALGTAAAVLYISEGLPYGIVKEFAPMYLRFEKVDLTSIGFLNVVGFAWTFKFLWSPLVDTYGTYRRWIAGAVLAIALALIGMAVMPRPGPPLYTLLALLALASATQDIAVDAFTIRATPSGFLGPINSIRVTAYRVALLSPGLLAIVAQRFGWSRAFGTAAVVALAILAFTIVLPDDRGSAAEAGGAAAPERPNLIVTLRRWLTRPHALILLGIILTYRLGEFAIVSMIKPYWVDRGYSPAEIGTITSVVGVFISIAGAITGGIMVARFGLYRALMVLGVTQSASNIGYAIVATIEAGRWAIYAAAVVENIGYGMGTSAFLAFLMSICDREHAATEYALITATYGVTGTLIASFGGAIAQHAGYPFYFWMTVFLGVPALFLLPLVREDLHATSNSHR
jgi:PAT family beta-lactamase induction signal transducer AmpG